MIRSINTKILLLVLSILVTIALVVMFFTKRDLERELLGAEEKSVRNAIYLVKLNIENQYGSLLFHKMVTLEKRKSEMKKLVGLVMSNVDQYQKLVQQGILSEEDARVLALDWIKALRCDDDSCFFAYDEKGTVLAHPDEATIGKDMSALKDVKGMSVFLSMLERTRSTGEGTTIFNWYCKDQNKASRKLGYFTYYAPLKWVVATAVNAEDIEADAQKRLDAIISDLKETFGHVKTAQSGFLFVFNGNKEIIIPPPPTSGSLTGKTNLLTGNPLLDDLKAAAQHPDTPIKYAIVDDKSDKGQKLPFESYVQYFKTLDWYIASSTPEDEIILPARKAVVRQVGLIAVIFVISIFITCFLVRQISQPLKKLAFYAIDLPKHDFSTPETSSEILRLPERYRDEVGRLAEAFIFMEESLRQYIIDLRETTAAKERIESELKIASDIQMSILPKTFPPYPERPEFDIFAAIKPAREVGGDFYDFFFIDDEHLLFTIGDVAGKGVPASLFMAVTKTLLKANAVSGISPAEILKRVNSKIAEDNETCVFVTVFCGVLNIFSGEMTYANGGHNPPVSIHSRDGANFISMPPGMALGIVEDIDYEEARLTLNKGDILVMYTDGVTEAMNSEYELYSEQRLQHNLKEWKTDNLAELSHLLMKSIEAFAGEAPQADDITMVLVKFNGPAQV